MSVTTLLPEDRDKSDEKTEYRAYFVIAYPLFFIAAVINRLSPVRGRSTRRAVKHPTIFHEAAELANGVLPWVFSGR